MVAKKDFIGFLDDIVKFIQNHDMLLAL